MPWEFTTEFYFENVSALLRPDAAPSSVARAMEPGGGTGRCVEAGCANEYLQARDMMMRSNQAYLNERRGV